MCSMKEICVNMESPTDCAICLEVVGDKNRAVTECGHIFHVSCICRASANQSSCPMCRTSLFENPQSNNQSTWASIGIRNPSLMHLIRTRAHLDFERDDDDRDDNDSFADTIRALQVYTPRPPSPIDILERWTRRHSNQSIRMFMDNSNTSW